MEWVEWMWRVALPLANTEARPSGTCWTGSFISKMEMAMRCNNVGGQEVGVKCGCIQGCCVGARPRASSWWTMVQVVVSTKTNKFGAAARQSDVSPHRAPIIDWGSLPQWWPGKKDVQAGAGHARTKGT